MLDVDELGLDDIDRRILKAIIEKFDGGPVGIETLAAATSEENDTIMDVYEPYLIQLGFLQRTPRVGSRPVGHTSISASRCRSRSKPASGHCSKTNEPTLRLR